MAPVPSTASYSTNVSELSLDELKWFAEQCPPTDPDSDPLVDEIFNLTFNPSSPEWKFFTIELHIGDWIQLYSLGAPSSNVSYNSGVNHVDGWGIDLATNRFEEANSNYPCSAGNKFAAFVACQSEYYVNRSQPSVGKPGGFTSFDSRWMNHFLVRESGILKGIFNDCHGYYDDNSGPLSAQFRIRRPGRAFYSQLVSDRTHQA